MKVIRVRNVHEALPEAMHQILAGPVVTEETRNGPVHVMLEPVTTVYSHPRERVIFWPERDANPFFHFYEALWMLGGRNDVEPLTRFVKGMKAFSDDGVYFHGAYGHRWRRHFEVDQLMAVIHNLRKDALCRRQIITMFDPRVDLAAQDGMKDIPCNIAVHFQHRGGLLDMTVFNRSNDIVWGAYGANAVHFSMLHEVVASMAKIPMGSFYQISDNWHAYHKTVEPLLGLAAYAAQPPALGARTPYEEDGVRPFPMVNRADPATWFGELQMFLDLEHRAMGYTEPFFRRVALPIVETHNLFKAKQYADAMTVAGTIKATDWRRAIVEWLDRREAKREAK
ncbi:MAG: hypothetical protein DRQ48_00160 [Gammaproteobacteria bacterium]|nr:MAG: hypothetical protein DRQ48_00160 [Gammaproteobacteria bacterium]